MANVPIEPMYVRALTGKWFKPLKVTRIPSFLVNKTSVQHLRHHNADKRRTIITRAANNFQETGDGRSLRFRRVRRCKCGRPRIVGSAEAMNAQNREDL